MVIFVQKYIQFLRIQAPLCAVRTIIIMTAMLGVTERANTRVFLQCTGSAPQKNKAGV